MQYDDKYSMKKWSQVIRGVEFRCAAATQGTHHVNCL